MDMKDVDNVILRILTVDEDMPVADRHQTGIFSGPPGTPFSINPEFFENRDDAVRSVRTAREADQPFAVSFIYVRNASLSRDMETAEMIRNADPEIDIAVIVVGAFDFHEELADRVPPPDKLMFLRAPIGLVEIRHAALVLGTKWLAGFPKPNKARSGPIPEETEKDHFFQLVMRNLPFPFFIKDRNGRYIHVNEAYAKIFKVDPSERIGKTDSDFWSPGIVRELRANDNVVMMGKKILRTVELVTVKNKTRRYYTTKFPIIMDKTSVYLGGISLRAPEKEKTDGLGETTTDDLRANGEDIPFDLTIVTHFLISGRTHMNGILGVCDLMKDTNISRRQSEYLNIVHVSALSMLELLNNIKDFSRMKSGNLELENKLFSLRELLDEIERVFFKDFSEKPIKMTVRIAPDLPEFLEADPLRLRQILVNLVSNALRFTGKGEIRITVGKKRDENEMREAGNVFPLFSIRDTGIGIANEIKDNLFEIFTHPDNSTVWKYGGTGLGLALCKQLVTLMGGDLWVESEPGMGSVFYFWIKTETPAEGIGKQITADDPVELSGIRVLLAEDHPVNLKVAEKILTKSGITVTTVVNGAEAVEAVRLGKYDAVLMDIQMPVMNGIEAARIIRKELGEKDLPIIAVTARDLFGDREKCLDAGMNDYIAKPVDRKKLIDGLRRNITRSVGLLKEEVKTMGDVSGRDGEAGAEQNYPKELPGLNIEEGVERLGGTWDLYADLVIFLCKDKKDFVREITDHVEKKEFDLARVKAHSLKGSAATVSATRLCADAKELEIACMDQKTDHIERALHSITDAFVQIMESAKTIEAIVNSQSKPPESEHFENPELLTIAEDLLKCFAESDPLGSESLMSKIRAFSNSEPTDIALGELLKTLISETERYDYEAARITIEKIIGKLRGEE